MRYTAINGGIQVKPIIPVKLHWKTISYHMLFIAPIVSLIFINTIIGWSGVEEPMKTPEVLFIAWSIAYFLVSFSIYLIKLEDAKPLFSITNGTKHTIYDLLPANMENDIYKEAVNDCIEEIKSKSCDYSFWSQQFRSLNKEIEKFERELQKSNMERLSKIPRKNYSEWLKETNAIYLGEQ